MDYRQNIDSLVQGFVTMDVAHGAEWHGNPLAKRRLKEAFRGIKFQAMGAGSFYNKDATDAEILSVVQANHKYKKDADSSSFFARELEVIDPIKYKEIFKPSAQWKDIFPFFNENIPASTSYTYEQYTTTGMPSLRGTGSDTVVNLAGTEATQTTTLSSNFGFGYGFTVDELRAAAFTGRPLEMYKMQAVEDGYNQKFQNIIFGAEDSSGIRAKSVVTNTDVAERQSTGGTSWATKYAADPQTVLDDIKASSDQIWTANKGNETLFPNGFDVVLPNAQRGILGKMVKPSAGGDVTLEQHILANKGTYRINRFITSYDMTGKGTGASDLAFWFPKNQQVFEVRMSHDKIWQPMQVVDWTYKWICDAEIYGGIFRYPLACLRHYDI